MYAKADKIAILSHFFRDYLINQNVASSKIIDFVSGSDEKFYCREKNKNLLNRYSLKNKIVIGYIGTFGISHNHEDILSVFRSLKRSDLHLFMVGEGAKKKMLNDFIKKYQITNVTLKDSVKSIEVPDYWSVCDLAIISLANTKINKTVIPSKILEAMKMGLPILLYTPRGEVTRFFAPSKATWHVESDHIEKLEKLIHSLSREIIEEKKEKAIQFSKKFSREAQAQVLLKTIDAFCKKEANEYEEI